MEFNFIEQIDISRQRLLLSEFSRLTHKYRRTNFDNSFSAEMFGDDPEYNIQNDLTYLFAYLLSIDAELQNHLNNGNLAPWYDKKYYIELYQIEKLRKHFKCIGLDITPLLALIQLNTVEIPGGIDFMYIEGNPEDAQSEVFTVS